MPRLIVLIILFLAAGCTGRVGSPVPTGTILAPSPTPSSPPPTDSPTPSPAPTNEGFPFAPSAIVGYYESLGYTCGDERPSTVVEGFAVQTCTLLDPHGRTRTIGVVTDPDGLVANGFASIKGTSDETFLEPTAALEPLSAFLGAMLGEERGADLVPWLAGHLGDTYAETTSGPITVATYTPTAEDHSTLTVEVGNDEYLDAPQASPSASPSPTASG
jgi:hypothetical protein